VSRHVFVKAADDHEGMVAAVDLFPEDIGIVAAGVVLELENS
jgi:hypothetical protein